MAIQDWDMNTCHHGYYPAGECRKCDAEIDAMGGIDKCLNCGSYKYGNELDKNQCCIKPCRNPNEY